MSLFCSFDKSTSGYILQRVASYQRLARRPYLESTGRHCHGREVVNRRYQSHSRYGDTTLCNWFINALVTAGKCRDHIARQPMPQIIRHRQESRKHLMHTSRLNHVTITRRHQQTSALPKPFRELSAQEELLGLVDQYDGGSMMDHLPLLELPSLDQPEPGPHLSISDKPEDCDYPPLRYVWPAHGKEQEVVRSLKKALGDISVNP